MLIKSAVGGVCPTQGKGPPLLGNRQLRLQQGVSFPPEAVSTQSLSSQHLTQELLPSPTVEPLESSLSPQRQVTRWHWAGLYQPIQEQLPSWGPNKAKQKARFAVATINGTESKLSKQVLRRVTSKYLTVSPRGRTSLTVPTLWTVSGGETWQRAGDC